MTCGPGPLQFLLSEHPKNKRNTPEKRQISVELDHRVLKEMCQIQSEELFDKRECRPAPSSGCTYKYINN